MLGVVSPRQILDRPDSIRSRPIGTGPFVVADHVPGKKAVLERRADYAWAPAYIRHEGPAYLDRSCCARQSQDASERDRLYRAAQKLLTELVPVVPLHESHHLIAYAKRLRGVLFDTTHNTPILTGAWLESPQKSTVPDNTNVRGAPTTR